MVNDNERLVNEIIKVWKYTLGSFNDEKTENGYITDLSVDECLYCGRSGETLEFS